ncbi:MAG: PA2779 family protein [Desulfobacterales bacterium]
MRSIRRHTRTTGIILAVMMFLISTPYQSALAALINTETVLAENQSQEARDYLKQLMARDDIRSALIAHGIDPLEAEARITSLSDSEIIELSDQIENLPAGGDAIGLVIAVLVIIVLVLVIMKLK